MGERHCSEATPGQELGPVSQQEHSGVHSSQFFLFAGCVCHPYISGHQLRTDRDQGPFNSAYQIASTISGAVEVSGVGS